MIFIEIKDSFFQYDAFHITKAFYPNEIIKSKVIEDSTYMLSFFYNGKELFHISQEEEDELPDKSDKTGRKKCKHGLNIRLYEALKVITNHDLDWGILTGIRPTKIAMKKWQSMSKNSQDLDAQVQTKKWLQSYYKVSEEKANLAVEIAVREQKLLSEVDLVEGYSLYVGIPFCKTRCSYCSFTAYPLEQWESRMEEYLEALFKELAFVGESSKHKKLHTIYIGGGTPTTLTAKQLERLLYCIEEHFSFQYLQEFTVEAGRPDTITFDKLEVMKRHKISRISINPQTMQEKTLKKIGRNHSVQEVYDVYEQARNLGFDNINMDLIMGLPEETLEDVRATLEAIYKLNPDSLTIHSLAMKRASVMTIEGFQIEEAQPMAAMIDLAAEYAEKMDLKPYYLYRQKNMAGNYENVGYAKVDKAGIYNILIMEEKQSIVAIGAGASTKIVLPRETDNIIRIENVKDVNEYITRIDEMISRKGEWLWH